MACTASSMPHHRDSSVSRTHWTLRFFDVKGIWISIFSNVWFKKNELKIMKRIHWLWMKKSKYWIIVIFGYLDVPHKQRPIKRTSAYMHTISHHTCTLHLQIDFTLVHLFDFILFAQFPHANGTIPGTCPYLQDEKINEEIGWRVNKMIWIMFCKVIKTKNSTFSVWGIAVTL